MIKQLNILETKMNNMINSLAGYEIKIKIENKNIKFYKFSKKHNKILIDENVDDIEYINDTKDINLKSLCGYEKIIFNISLRLALNNMNTIIKNNFIYLIWIIFFYVFYCNHQICRFYCF